MPTWAAQCEVQLQLVICAELAQRWQRHMGHHALLALHDLEASTGCIAHMHYISRYISGQVRCKGADGRKPRRLGFKVITGEAPGLLWQ